MDVHQEGMHEYTCIPVCVLCIACVGLVSVSIYLLNLVAISNKHILKNIEAKQVLALRDIASSWF